MLVITNSDGTKQEFVVKNGKDGRDGKDGNCTCSDKPVPPHEDKPEKPKGDKPETPREDKPEDPKGDRPETPREDKLEEPKGDKPQVPSVTPQIPMKTPEQLLPTIDGIKVDGSKGETDTSVFIGSTVLLALYLLRRKEN